MCCLPLRVLRLGEQMVGSDMGMRDVGKASWPPSVVVAPSIVSSGQPFLCAAILTSAMTIVWSWPPYLYPTLAFTWL